VEEARPTGAISLVDAPLENPLAQLLELNATTYVAVVPPPELQVAHTEEGEVPYTDRPTGRRYRRSLLGCSG